MSTLNEWMCVAVLAFLGPSTLAQIPSATTSMFSVGTVTAVPQFMYAPIWPPLLGDFDGDGLPDIIGDASSGHFGVWHRNRGGGQFSGQNYASLPGLTGLQGPLGVRFVDLDADGILDAVGTIGASAGVTPPGATVVWLRRPGTPQEFLGPFWIPLPPPPFQVIAVDFQPIRSTDRMAIIRTTRNNTNLMSRVEVYAFDSASLTMPLIGSRDLPGVSVENSFAFPDLVDTNRDGVMDLVLVRQIFPPSVGLPPITTVLGTELLVLEGVEDPLTGGISFPNAVSYPLFNFPSSVRYGAWKDMNRDGWGDFAIGGEWVVFSDGQGGFLPPTPWAMWNQWG
ncbi:MAG TPA: VCBS repeat-containing protein, partial [Planctomycetota bacterium]|nr:VCBS repeat-containing protein [Planctomycetota bacterium]